jgi:polyphenol oxidase
MSFARLLLRTGPISCWSVGRGLDGSPFDAREPSQVSRLARHLGLDGAPRQAVQEHGTAIDEDGSLEACDAFLLEAGQSALVRHADCFPVVVADPVCGRAALAHCGWRGTLAGLAGLCARRMVAAGSRPEDLVAAIGAGIGAESFEVGPELLERFPSRFHAKTVRGTPSIDLASFLREDLQAAGVAAVEIRSPDTFRDDAWHSHRRDGGHSGRNATICIVEPSAIQPGVSR